MASEDEERLAAFALGGILTSVLLRAYEEHRTWLYSWEREGLKWLIRFRDRRPDGFMDNDWMCSFLDLNKVAILSDGGQMNFNLRAARQEKGGC